MAERPTHTKQYIINSISMAVTITLISCLIVITARIKQPLWLKLTFGLSAHFFIFLGLYEAFSITNRMIFIDAFTQTTNGSWVMKKVYPIYKCKKLHKYAALYTNIKEFKYLNQRFNPSVGDRILIQYTKQLTKYVKEHRGFCGRLGGDNFFIVIHKKECPELIEYLKNTVVTIEIDGEVYNLHIKSRMGINYLTDESDFKNLIFFSNIAQTVGKENFNDVTVFEPSMLEEYNKEKTIVADVQRALKADEFIPHYQPKVNVKTAKLSGAEALVRWNKEGLLIPPGEFIHALEKAGVIDEVDFRVFEKVCKDLRAWIDEGIEPVRVSTNFSKLNLKNPDFIKRIIEIKNKYNIDGKYLEVELTESAGVTNFDVIQQFAQEIKEAGMSVAIDDFGTGYSSLSMLQTVHADVVKMDKSFLDNCFQDDGDGKQFIVDVITIVRHQNSEVLFEGVETHEQLEFLREYDCDTIQGFYFNEPLSHDSFEKRLLNPQY